MSPAKKKQLSPAHKKAMSEGRSQAAAVRRYLTALDESKPKRGRRRTPESIARRLAAIESELESASSFQSLHLIQERKDLEGELSQLTSSTDISGLEDEFVSVAASYGESKGLSYGTWREAGVSPAVLKRAGITRGT